MKLASTLPEGQNYKIYADNYFTCVPLVVKLLDRGIHYVGTARQRTTIFRQREPSSDVTSRSPLNAQKRPSSGDGSPPNGAPSKRSQPPLDVRKDLMAHFPVKTKRGRCRHCSKGYTTHNAPRRWWAAPRSAPGSEPPQGHTAGVHVDGAGRLLHHTLYPAAAVHLHLGHALSFARFPPCLPSAPQVWPPSCYLAASLSRFGVGLSKLSVLLLG
ncbi:hypothetical protein F7725_004541 [Dissostichus mawsoni]|uniref:PiggyBac transposable element-derived protein domain-containing protein n=1 Tax=Dissostichus mawsoni TaxID=36200 RepID=A0A7J5XKE9_DISMA|nr:hypothetical protein F7725_004541 [Dissostichus mawsoni]